LLKGKKTYIVAILMAALSAVRALGLIDEGTYQAILALLSGLGLATLRAGVESTKEPTTAKKTPKSD